MIIIGSTAIKYWYPDFNRTPKDLDVIVTETEKLNIVLNYERVERLSNPILRLYHNTYHKNNKYATPDELYTLKMSHLFWDINWEKHLWDLHFLQDKGAKLIKALFDELYLYWNEVHGKNKRSDLKMTSNQFFNNAVECPYDHDWLHTLINPNPTFNKVLKDGQEVEVDEDKFNQLTEEEKEALVREEVEVMAFERMPTFYYWRAYNRMLKKFIISHAPIWEAIWILVNYRTLYKPKYNFIEHLNKQINERGDNIVKRLDRSSQQ